MQVKKLQCVKYSKELCSRRCYKRETVLEVMHSTRYYSYNSHYGNENCQIVVVGLRADAKKKICTRLKPF